MTENYMRAMLCGCGRRLEDAEDERLCERAVAHLKQDHLTAHVDRELVQGKIGYVKAYPNGSGPDKEFGLEPY